MDSVREVLEAFGARVLAIEASFRPFSAVGVLAPPKTPPKSKALPGDFGAFDDPKEAKAPDPNPNALDAPAVGDGIAAVGEDMALKGFALPCDEVSPPYRLESV